MAEGVTGWFVCTKVCQNILQPCARTQATVQSITLAALHIDSQTL